MGGHRGERMKGDTGRARDIVDDRALVVLRQRPASPENAYLAMSRSRLARGTAQRRESAYGPAEVEECTSSCSSSSQTLVITGGQRGLNQNWQPPPPGHVRGTGKTCRCHHETLPSAPQEEPREADPAYYTPRGARGTQGVQVYMLPAFLPQESSGTQVQAQQIHGVVPSININQFHRPFNPRKGEIKEKDNKPAPSPRQQQQRRQQKQQRENNGENGAEKHASRYDDDDDDDEKGEQRYQQGRGNYIVTKKSKAKAAGGRERGRSSWDEALATLDVGNDTTHRRSASCSSSGDACDTCSFYDYNDDRHHDGMIRKRGTTRARRVPYSPDAFEDEIAMAAVAEEEKWKREQQERAARFKAKADKAKGGRGTGLPACSPGTYNNKKGYHPNQPSRSPKSRAQNKNSGGKGESKKGQAHMPKAKPARQNQQRHEQRSSDGGQQPRRAISSPDPFEGEIAMVTAARPGTRAAKERAKAKIARPKQRQLAKLSSAKPSSVKPSSSRVPYSPDAFDDEIAMATAAEAEKWKREQAQATKVKVKAKATSIADRVEKTNGSSEESQYTKASGWTNEDGGNQVHNLIDL